MAYSNYEDFDRDCKFSDKAGFQLSKLQIEDVQACLAWPHSLNTYEVGGGKTVVSTVVSLMRGVDFTIVTVPPILISPWVRWLRTVSERVIDYRGSPARRAKIDITSARWLVLSHALFREDFEKLLSAISARKGAAVELIVDEAHALKNIQSVLFKKVETFVAGDSACQLLTGTPINKPLDAYAYIKLKTPGKYRGMGHFEAVHVAERDFWNTPTVYANLAMLKQNLELQTISRTKEDLHGYSLKPLFPDTTYDLSKEHYRLYQKLVDEQLLEFENGRVIDASTSQRLRQALQQVVVNFDHFSGDPAKRSASYDIIDLSLEETECATIGKSKLIIWTKYRRTTESILAYLTKQGVQSVAAYGNGKSSQAIDSFMDIEATRVLVAQYQSASAGLNPQGVCSEALFLEGETVPLYMRQAIGRINRMGQTKTPRIRIAVANGTVQVGIFGALLKNDNYLEAVEPTKKSLRAMLLGESPPLT